MGVDVAHFVPEAAGDTDEQVVDYRADCEAGQHCLGFIGRWMVR